MARFGSAEIASRACAPVGFAPSITSARTCARRMPPVILQAVAERLAGGVVGHGPRSVGPESGLLVARLVVRPAHRFAPPLTRRVRPRRVRRACAQRKAAQQIHRAKHPPRHTKMVAPASA